MFNHSLFGQSPFLEVTATVSEIHVRSSSRESVSLDVTTWVPRSRS